MSILLGAKGSFVRGAVIAVLIVAVALSVTGTPQRTAKPKMACKTTENEASCYWTHGKLMAYNGTPTMRLWKVGTKRILAIHSGPGFKLGDDHENSDPAMPDNVERALSPFENVIFADFEICPLEPEHTGVMQRACIESAKNIVVQ